MFKYLLIALMFSIPSYSQESSELSPAAKLLVANAQKEKSTPNLPKPLGFSIAVTTRFDGGVTFPLYGDDAMFDLFNVTSLEFYSATGSRDTRLLATMRFSTPVLADHTQDFLGLYKQRLGFGLGVSSTISDNRDSKGHGIVTTMNILLASDYMFLSYDLNNYEQYTLLGNYALYRLDSALRFNQFLKNRTAIVYGVDFGIGFAMGYEPQELGSDGYPIEPLSSYGVYARGVFTFGVSIGLMF